MNYQKRIELYEKVSNKFDEMEAEKDSLIPLSILAEIKRCLIELNSTKNKSVIAKYSYTSAFFARYGFFTAKAQDNDGSKIFVIRFPDDI